MSTSLMFHAFGARCHDYLRTEYRQGAIYFHIETKSSKRRCVCCGSRQVTLHGTETQTLRTLPIGSRPVFLVLHLHDLHCRKCGAIRQEDRIVAAPMKRYTKAFGRFVLGLCKKMTISDVARHLGMGWHTVKGILKEHLEKRAARRSWRRVKRVAIDEIAIRKGHRYMTVIVDLTTGELLFTAEGRDHTCLKPFFHRLSRAGAKLEAIAVDMSHAYRKAIRDFGPPGVVVVHDRYHLVSAMNHVIDKVRRSEQNRQEEEGKKFIKGSRYLLLYAKENLAKKPPEKQERLERLLEANEILNKGRRGFRHCSTADTVKTSCTFALQGPLTNLWMCFPAVRCAPVAIAPLSQLDRDPAGIHGDPDGEKGSLLLARDVFCDERIAFCTVSVLREPVVVIRGLHLLVSGLFGGPVLGQLRLGLQIGGRLLLLPLPALDGDWLDLVVISDVSDGGPRGHVYHCNASGRRRHSGGMHRGLDPATLVKLSPALGDLPHDGCDHLGGRRARGRCLPLLTRHLQAVELAVQEPVEGVQRRGRTVRGGDGPGELGLEPCGPFQGVDVERIGVRHRPGVALHVHLPESL